MFFKRTSVLVGSFLTVLLLNRCAQVVPLTGGAKDTIPPTLISMSPANRSTNMPVRRTKIIFKFNEMVAVQNVSQKMIINPLTAEMPEVVASGKDVIVSFDKDLEPNTTYFIQLGNAVVDIHESNPYRDLNYIFSTGPAIDTAYITGKVTYALQLKPAPEVSVMLYKNLSDSVPLTGKPDYTTRTNENGKYFLSAMKPGTYQAIAFLDKNKNQQYDAAEAIGFLNKPVDVDQDTVNFELSLPKTEKVFIKKKIQAFWGYNKYVMNDTFPNAYMITEKSIDADKYLYEMRNDTLEVYYRNLYGRNFEFVLKNEKTPFDTISLNIPSKTAVDSSVERGCRKLGVRAEKAMYGAKHDDVVFNFSVPVSEIKLEKCMLWKEKEKETAKLTAENRNEAGNLVTTFLPSYKRRLLNDLEPQRSYTLMFLPGSVQTYWGNYNVDTLRVTFKTFAADEMGSLQVKLRLPDTMKNYVLQVLTSKEIVVREAAGSYKRDSVQYFYNLPAGDYLLRLIDDKDQNRKFSPASYPEKRQPEKVFFNATPVKIPAGWDVESSWMLNKEEKK